MSMLTLRHSEQRYSRIMRAQNAAETAETSAGTTATPKKAVTPKKKAQEMASNEGEGEDGSPKKKQRVSKAKAEKTVEADATVEKGGDEEQISTGKDGESNGHGVNVMYG